MSPKDSLTTALTRLRALAAHFDVSRSTIQTTAQAAMNATIEHVKENPYNTGAMVAGNIALYSAGGPVGVLGKTMGLVGFGPSGPIANSLAAQYQATHLGGFIPAESWFAFLQRLGMILP